MSKPPSKSPRQSIIERGQASNASEDAIQALCFLWLNDLRHSSSDPRLAWIYAVPNGGSRDKVSAGIMVATGTRSGIWDVALPFPAGRWPFAAIEMKRPQVRGHKNGGLSDSQVEYGKHLVAVGAWYAVCYSADEFMVAVQRYVRGEEYYATTI